MPDNDGGFIKVHKKQRMSIGDKLAASGSDMNGKYGAVFLLSQ